MTILFFPNTIPAPNSMSLTAAGNTQSGGRSPFDGTEQVLALPGARWLAEMRWQNLTEAEWRTLGAFIATLNGRAGRFVYSPNFRFPRRGTATGTPLVNGGSQTGSTLATDGWNAGVAFLPGDLLGYVDPTGRQMMHRVTATATVSSGACTVAIWPPLRRSPADNTALQIVSPSPTWRLSTDGIQEDYEPGERGFSVTLPLEEAIW
jgi:hypothetical protein